MGCGDGLMACPSIAAQRSVALNGTNVRSSEECCGNHLRAKGEKRRKQVVWYEPLMCQN